METKVSKLKDELEKAKKAKLDAVPFDKGDMGFWKAATSISNRFGG